MYYRSVGHNSTLILGLTPGPDGLMPGPDVRRLRLRLRLGRVDKVDKVYKGKK